jgi:hypothetical protein
MLLVGLGVLWYVTSAAFQISRQNPAATSPLLEADMELIRTALTKFPLPDHTIISLKWTPLVSSNPLVGAGRFLYLLAILVYLVVGSRSTSLER